MYKLLPIWFVLLPKQSIKRVCPSVWPVVHGHVGSSEAMGSQAASWLRTTASSWAARLAGAGGRGSGPISVAGDNGQGVYFLRSIPPTMESTL